MKMKKRNGGEYDISAAEIKDWEKRFPGVDVREELRYMQGWLEANPSRRKKSVKRFVTNWLIRESRKKNEYAKNNWKESERISEEADRKWREENDIEERIRRLNEIPEWEEEEIPF